MTREDFLRNYWNYYLSLENRVIQTAGYVSIDPDNYKTFSNEYALLMQAIGGELDAFFKEYCAFNQGDYKTIADYASKVLVDYPGIKSQNITVVGTKVKIHPFDGWNISQAKQSLAWWAAYDDIKHSRYVNIKSANQKNVLDILGGLFLMEMKYLQKITAGKKEPDIPNKISELFSLDGWSFNYVPLNSAMALIDGGTAVELG